MKFEYQFPAIKGKQAHSEYYIAMIPLSVLSKIFPKEDDIVQAELRAQRKINISRVPEIKNYILDNRDTYVFSALSASIDGDFRFENIGEKESNLGILKINMNSTFLINDGQHRKAALEEAMREDISLEEETISIVFFKDEGLRRSQQMFTDLNKHAVKTSNSLSTLYNARDELAVATKKVIEDIPFFARYTDKERDILGKNSSKLFTLNTIYKANKRIFNSDKIKEEDLKFLLNYWTLVSDNINEWTELKNKEITKKDLKENYIITLSVTINALGRLGKYFIEHKSEMEKTISKLKHVDWSRSNMENWGSRSIRNNGKVVMNEEAIILTCSKIKLLLGIELSKEEEAKEAKRRK